MVDARDKVERARKDRKKGKSSKDYGEFMDDTEKVEGYSAVGDINPAEEYDDETLKEMFEERDEWYDNLRDMYENDRSPIWNFIRKGRIDELLRAIMILDKVSTTMGESVTSVRNLEHTSEFSERYSIPIEFKRHAKDVKSLLDEGEIKGAKNRVDDMITDFNKYRRVAISTTSMVTSEFTKVAYLIDGIRFSQDIIRDVRHTMKNDNALLVSNSDVVEIAEVVYDVMIDKLIEENDDLVIPRDIANVRDDLEDSLMGSRRGKSYKETNWKERVNKLIGDFLKDEYDKVPSQVSNDELKELVTVFGLEPVDRFFESRNVRSVVGDKDE